MDAITHVNIAHVEAMDANLAVRLMVLASGECCVFVNATIKRKEMLIGFTHDEWQDFKRAAIAADKAIADLRRKGLIFDFEASRSGEIELPPVPGQSRFEPRGTGDTVKVTFLAEKTTASGEVLKKECANFAEIEEFARL